MAELPLAAISWWCTATGQPWTWSWIPYPGVWLAVAVPLVAYLRATSRRPPDRRRRVAFIAGMAVFWVASDWPLGTLGAGYLASAHMTQFLLYTLGAAPLLLLGIPEDLATRMLGRLTDGVRRLGRSPILCGVVYNLLLLVTHSPPAVETLRRSQVGSFTMDLVWMTAGFVLWLPILSPLAEGRPRTVAARMAYLFAATAVVAVIPASLLTFADTPVYEIYELAPRVWGLSARADQQLAGIVMKLGTIPVVWGTLGTMWFRWASRERPADRLGTPPR